MMNMKRQTATIFDKDFWQEVLQTIRCQKWRSLMTAFGVFWGLLMLMFLIGAGIGFREGAVGQLDKMPSNSVAYFSKLTTMPYQGFDRGRAWQIDENDLTAIGNAFPNAVKTSVFVKYLPQSGSQVSVSVEDMQDEVPLIGVTPGYYEISPQRMVAGRYVNAFDCMERRKVCVIGDQVAKVLFDNEASAVGRNLKIDNTNYEVIGVVRKKIAMVNFLVAESQSVFVPITTGQQMYNCFGKADNMFLVLNDKWPSGDYCKNIEAIIRHRHNLNPDDELALESLDLKNQLNQFDLMIGGLNALVWLVGLGTLLAGLIGISNIMMVTVKERTHEIGVRRALGAQPRTIIRQIMCESLVLTLAAGVGGIVVGVWGMYSVNRLTAGSMASGGFFANPHVPFLPAVAALIILVIGGLFAGYVPAKRAMKIKAIEALREE